ncbi:hypothetical protein BASA50_000722 [Batrachochytrium salamandrivorans]|uniref:N-acetyltransferase domain-containing protein n=1 Tax=Batrachochytrium salamandrivorans TaxID=1357716 RepID=A0ABQ8EWG1_9FUNG|nr:hypothetical protein BASA62_001254 [Batrachochytrium salamandrivorans]KAH6585202.1 hypothetical protein BASA61_006995 [Batrachochytrium salamandrivorans]KAH6586258.1 hypothetical protein BASA50_000722 [Batrachochytrium salamandrivorans]KAH9265571.1 hypothetical protein BASA84_001575 [Batrachochytrium salamandrivorans]KAH9275887.1 hypothetical protein BASA83_001693 [Batrachochytrium salamandrivorans]
MTPAPTKPTVRYVVREAVVSDAQTLVAIINDAYRTDKGWTHEAHLISDPRISVQGLEALIENPAMHILVIGDMDTGLIIGSIEIEHFDTTAKEVVGDVDRCFQTDAVMIGLLAIHPDYQSRGAGSFMMKAALQKCREMTPKKTTAVLYAIHTRDELIAWYMRIGFKPTGRTIDFVFPDLQKVDDAHFNEYTMDL